MAKDKNSMESLGELVVGLAIIFATIAFVAWQWMLVYAWYVAPAAKALGANVPTEIKYWVGLAIATTVATARGNSGSGKDEQTIGEKLTRWLEQMLLRLIFIGILWLLHFAIP